MDHALALPWDRYENYDMVVWGVRERVEEGEMEGAYHAIAASHSPETLGTHCQAPWQAAPCCQDILVPSNELDGCRLVLKAKPSGYRTCEDSWTSLQASIRV